MLRPASLFRAVECAPCEASGSRSSRASNRPSPIQQTRTYVQQNRRPNGQGPGRAREHQGGRASPENRFARNLLVGMPRTSKPGDLMRVMKELGAVDMNFPLTSITAPPISLPRSPRPYKAFHVQFKTLTEASQAYNVLSSNPTFFPHSSSVSMVDTTGAELNSSMITRAQMELAARENPQQASASGVKRELNFNKEWMTRPGYSGRTISISGLPFGFPIKTVKSLVLDRYFSKDTKRTIDSQNSPSTSPRATQFESPLDGEATGLNEHQGIISIPSTSVHSRFGVSFKTVEGALRAARQLNMTRFRNTSGKTYVIRASIVW